MEKLKNKNSIEGKESEEVKTNFAASAENIPQNIANDQFNLDEELQKFQGFLSCGDAENAKESIISINKFIRLTKCNLDSFKTEEIITFLIQLITDFRLEGAQKFVGFSIKKEVFSLLTYIIQQSSEIAQFLVTNQIFPLFSPLMNTTEDTFTANSVVELFRNILKYGEEFVQKALESDFLANIVSSIDFYISIYSNEYLKRIDSILELSYDILNYPSLIEESVAQTIIGKTVLILSKIYERINKKSDTDYYLEQVRPVTSELDFIEHIAQRVSDITNSQEGALLQLVFNQRLIYVLNDFILNVELSERAWPSILRMDCDVLMAIHEEQEIALQLIQYLNPLHMINIFISKPNSDSGALALKYLFYVINLVEEVIDSLPIEEFIGTVIQKIEAIKIQNKIEVVRFALSLLFHRGADLIQPFLENGLLQLFNAPLTNSPEDLQLYSIQTYANCLEISAADKTKLAQLKELLCDEYESLLEEWSSSENIQLSEAANAFIEQIETE